MSCGVGRRLGSDLALQWLWGRPAAVASFRPLAWEPPYAAPVALKKKKKTKKIFIYTWRTYNLKKSFFWWPGTPEACGSSQARD